MSENLKRSNPDFSKYDSMSIGELEEILRADAQGPERDDSDVDEILYVMEVLAKERQQNGIAGKTALEAYQEFQQHYLPMVEEEAKPKCKANIIPFRRIATIAASLVLVFTLATSANAFSIKDIWNAVARWAEETFSFSTGVEVSEPKAESDIHFCSLQDLLIKYEVRSDIVPTQFPAGYELTNIIVDENPLQDTYLAVYSDGSSVIKVSVKSFLEKRPEQVEASGTLLAELNISGTTYYFFENHDQIQAAWIIDTYECYVSGKLSVDEIISIIESIEKG